MSILDLIKMKPRTSMNTSLGRLALFTISLGNQSSLSKLLGSPLTKVDPTLYVKNLLAYACYPESTLDSEKHKPDDPVLTLSDVETLSREEIEKLARTYVKYNDYLYKGDLNKTSKNSGEPENKDNGEILYPKKESETWVDYLHRLACLEEERQHERMKAITSAIPTLNSFSNPLKDRIIKNFFLDEIMAKSAYVPKRVFTVKVPSAKTETDSLGWIGAEDDRKEHDVEPQNVIASKLDELFALLIEESREANKIQTEIASEIKNQTDQTGTQSKLNIWLTAVVILIAVVGISLDLFSHSSGISFSIEQQSSFENYGAKVIESIETVGERTIEVGNSSEDTLNELVRGVQTINDNVVSTNSLLTSATQEISELKQLNTIQDQEIQQLKIQLDVLKEAIRKKE